MKLKDIKKQKQQQNWTKHCRCEVKVASLVESAILKAHGRRNLQQRQRRQKLPSKLKMKKKLSYEERYEDL